jgi:hypothetical protein
MGWLALLAGGQLRRTQEENALSTHLGEYKPLGERVIGGFIHHSSLRVPLLGVNATQHDGRQQEEVLGEGHEGAWGRWVAVLGHEERGVEPTRMHKKGELRGTRLPRTRVNRAEAIVGGLSSSTE